MATFDVTKSLGVAVVNASTTMNTTSATLGRNKIRKARLLNHFTSTFISANSLIFFTVDNIPTTHLQQIKDSISTQFPGQARFVFGKNTLFKRAIKSINDPKLTQLLPFIRGNVACLSCSDRMNSIEAMKFIEQSSIQVAAKPGMIANTDLIIPRTITQLSPEKTSFFASAGINTKITGGKIEIFRERVLTPKGSKVDETASRLLELLKMKPIFFDMKVKIIYENGELLDVDVIRSIEKTLRTGVDKILNIRNWITGEDKVVERTVGQVGVVEQGDEREGGVVGDGEEGGMLGIFGDEEENEDEEQELFMSGIFGDD